ncbi:MAG: LrgB family protein, partial [Thermoguttaceae bacterium]|nr:LrgB family protein [Thermoguttaceae bacterium]
ITAKLFDLERVYYVTCLTKSITTAIGMGVTEELGGDVTIAVVMIILSGICGAVFGEKTLKLFHVTDPMAQGLAIGTASHAIGTSKALEMGETVGASSGLAIVVTGVLTVVLAPVCAGLIG